MYQNRQNEKNVKLLRMPHKNVTTERTIKMMPSVFDLSAMWRLTPQTNNPVARIVHENRFTDKSMRLID